MYSVQLIKIKFAVYVAICVSSTTKAVSFILIQVGMMSAPYTIETVTNSVNHHDMFCLIYTADNVIVCIHRCRKCNRGRYELASLV